MKTRGNLTLIIAAALIVPVTLLAQGKGNAFKYVGVKGCKACHMTTKSGAAFKIWQKSKHAQAFKTLATPKAKEIAKKKGIADPQKSEKCLKCHDTAFGKPATQLAKTFKPGEGVGCEVCHGPGSKYKSMKVMKDLNAGKIKGETVGFMKADEKLCVKCHNEESPSYKEFNFAEFQKKIAHPTPTKK